MNDIDSVSSTNEGQAPAPKFTLGLKIVFDLLFYFSNFFLLIGVMMMLLIGFNIPTDSEKRHTDIHYLFSFKVLPNETDPALATSDSSATSITEVIQGQATIKLNNTRGHAAWYVSNLSSLLVGIVSVISLYYLRRLFANLAQKLYFTPENTHCVKRIGQIIIASSLLYPVLMYLGGRAILADIGSFHPQVELTAPLTAPISSFIIGIAMLVLAQVLKEAAAIQQEQSLTI